jgi:hypothetical protein
MKIYRDGKLWQSGTGNFNAMGTSAYVTIGAYGQSSGYSTYHTGYIGQMQLYSRAITDEEVRQNYNAGKWRYQRPAPMVRSGGASAPGSSPATAAASATEIKELTGTTQNGFYWIRGTTAGGTNTGNSGPADGGTSSVTPPGQPSGMGHPIRVWCDMNYKGGGWHLVMANCKSTLSPPGGSNGLGQVSYWQCINNITYNGNYDSNLAFRVLVGLKHWPALGLNVAQFCSTAPRALSDTANHTKRYLWSYAGFGSNYGFLSAAAVGDDGSGAGSPGMYSYHAASGFGFSAIDTPFNTCPGNYGQTPFWYGGCWSGNMWGGGNSGSYQDGPFWDSSGSDYHNYMAVYLR